MSDKAETSELLKSEQLPEYAEADGSNVKLSADKLRSLGMDLSERFSSISKYRERGQWEQDKADAFDAYHMVEKQRDLAYAGAANLRCILPRIGVDAWQANIMYSIFGNGNRSVVRPKLILPEFQNQAKRTANFLSVQLEHEADFYSVCDDAIKKAGTYGIAYLEPRYVTECAYETVKETIEESIPESDPVTGETSIKTSKRSVTKKKKVSTFDGIKIESLPVESVYVSPFARNLDEAVKNDGLYKAFTLTWEVVENRSRKGPDGQDAFYYPEAVKTLKGSVVKRVLNVRDDSALEQAKSHVDGFWLDYKCAKERIDLVEAHLWKDIDGDNIPEKIAVTLEPISGTVLRVSLAKCRIVEIRPWPIDERFYGESIPSQSKQVASEWEAIHNMRVNAGQWENTVFGFYRAGGRFNPSEITIQPGMFYPVDNPLDVQFAPTPGVRQSYFNEEGLLVNYFERITGLTENIQGLSSSRAQTATEQINATQKASIRLSNPLTRVVMSLEKLLGHMVDLNRDCAPKFKEYAISGIGAYPIFDKVYKDDYNTQLTYKLDIGTIFDEQLERDKWLMAYRMFIQDPNVMQHPAAVYDLTTKTLEAQGIQLNIPKPPQAKVLSAWEKLEIVQRGELVEPEVGEDYDESLKVYMAVLKSEKVKRMDDNQVQALMTLISKTQILKQTLEASNLNQSGQVPPEMLQMMQGMTPPTQPGVTQTRNPSQKFNTSRVGQTSASELNNAKNGGSNEPPTFGGY